MNFPTIAKANITSSYAALVDQSQGVGIRDITLDATESISISYLQGNLAIRSTSADRLQVRITNLAGQTVASLQAQLSGGYAEVSTEQLPAGVYIAIATDQQGHKATCKFIKR